jgi:hypothetical protein
MSGQQMIGVVVFLLGVATLIVSAGVAWTLSRITRIRRVESTWLVTSVSFALFVVGLVLCYFGVSALMGV